MIPKVRKVLEFNTSEKHIGGGLATKEVNKYIEKSDEQALKKQTINCIILCIKDIHRMRGRQKWKKQWKKL